MNTEACRERLKRYWRRRRYQKLSDYERRGRRKLKVVRLGGGQRQLVSKQWKVLSPMKAFVSVHEAYVEMMVKLVNNIGKLSNKQVLGGKNKVARTKQTAVVSSANEVVDTKLLVQFYDRVVASRRLMEF